MNWYSSILWKQFQLHVLAHSTVNTVVKPVHKTDHYYHYGTPYLSFYLLLWRKRTKVILSYHKQYHFFYAKIRLLSFSSQNTISYKFTWNKTNLNIVYNIRRYEAQRKLIKNTLVNYSLREPWSKVQIY